MAFLWFYVLVIVLICVYCCMCVKRPKNYPPGPSWLPIVGNLPKVKELSKKLGGHHHAFKHLSNLYNSQVIGLKLGGELVVAVSGYEAVHEVLTNDEFVGRPENFFIKLRCMGQRRGITCLDGNPWVEQRSFVVKHLRSLGFGKKPMEEMVLEEVQTILNVLEENKTKEFRLEPIFAPSVIGVLWCLATGSSFARNDARLLKFLQILDKRSKAFDMAGGLMNQFPWLRFIVPEKIGYNMICKLNEEMKNFFTETIKDHFDRWYPDREDDLMFAFISEMRKHENSATFTEEQLIMICLDFFFAGSSTTSNTLDFIFFEMITHPEIQEKAANILRKCVPEEEDLTYADRIKVPYLEAIIMESERLHPVTPIIGPRRVMKDTVLDGFYLPKDTTVLINIYAVQHDADYWKDPEEFRPERFIDEEGKLKFSGHLLAFGLGRRRCLGELLARQCVFLFFAAVLRKYRILPASDFDNYSGKFLAGLTLTPQKYKVKLEQR